ARSCLDALAEVQPDMFLLDVNMPGMDGLTLAQELRDLGYNVPIVMLSADAREQQRQTLQPPYDDYLVKPLNNQLLLDRIGQLLSLEWHYGDTPAPEQPHIPPLPATLAQVPDHPLVRELLAHAQIGYPSGVNHSLSALEAESLIDNNTSAHFRELARRMEFEKLALTLESLVV